MLNLFLFLLRNLMMMKMKDFHMILMPQVQMIIQIPLPTTTPTSFVPGDHAQPAQQQSSQGTPALISSQDGDETEPYETDDTPVLTEEEIVQLQEDVDTEPYTSDHSHFVDIDGTVFFL